MSFFQPLTKFRMDDEVFVVEIFESHDEIFPVIILELDITQKFSVSKAGICSNTVTAYYVKNLDTGEMFYAPEDWLFRTRLEAEEYAATTPFRSV